MKRFIVILLLVSLFLACKNEYKARTINSINITTFKKDSTSIRAIEAVNDSTVYYAGSNGDIGYTNNNGKTWKTYKAIHQDTITPHFRSLASNGKTMFALSIANPALLYKIAYGKPQLVYKEIGKKVFYDSMKFFADGKHGIAVGDPVQDCASIILTSDGGTTWNKLPCSKLPKFEDGEAFFAASNTNIKIIGSTVWIASGGKKSRVLKSMDKGQTWKIFETPFTQGNGPQGIYSIDFTDELNGIAIGGDYSKPKENTNNKAITKDGGKTWQIVANNQNPSYKSCVQYVPDTDGKEVFAVGKTGVSFSSNGGLTWKEVSKEQFYTIMFVDKNTAWLSGHNKIGKLVLPKK